MVLTLQLLQLIAHYVEEARVGIQNGAIQGKLHLAHDPAQGIDLALEVGVELFLFGQIHGVFDDPDQLALCIQHRAAGAQGPHIPSLLVQPVELPLLWLAAAHCLPEGGIGWGLRLIP
ncbi:hypothetical protein D3C84_659820 [compost metagenome]